MVARWGDTNQRGIHPVTPDDLFEEIQRGRIYECSLRSERFVVDGLQSGENIYIDPRPAILETLCHELLHRKHPRWGERRVTREARRLVAVMDERTKQTWWLAYRRIVKRGRPVEVED